MPDCQFAGDRGLIGCRRVLEVWGVGVLNGHGRPMGRWESGKARDCDCGGVRSGDAALGLQPAARLCSGSGHCRAAPSAALAAASRLHWAICTLPRPRIWPGRCIHCRCGLTAGAAGKSKESTSGLFFSLFFFFSFFSAPWTRSARSVALGQCMLSEDFQVRLLASGVRSRSAACRPGRRWRGLSPSVAERRVDTGPCTTQQEHDGDVHHHKVMDRYQTAVFRQMKS